MRFGEREEEGVKINIVPLIDVLLTVIVFLFMAFGLSGPKVLGVSLPSAGPGGTASTPAQVWVDRGGMAQVDGQGVSAFDQERLFQLLGKLRQESQASEITLLADKDARHETVVMVLQAAKRAGFSGVEVAVSGEKEKGEKP